MELNFVNGRALVKNGRKTIAKVYDRAVFFKGTRFENSFARFPYSLEIANVGQRECKTLEEAVSFIETYASGG
jgi:hypothetical protein